MKAAKPKPSAVISGGTEPGFTLHKLRHDDFHQICGLVENVKTMIPDDASSSFGFSERLLKGERITSETPFRVGVLVVTPESKGIITGFAVDVNTMQPSQFARVNGRLYHVSTLKPA